ncbi:hypothetical protein C0991_005732 [Blastosporella zonata]|nr:hypothetical protein C0991_005732 [Blastosporella zonata]
MYNRDTVDSVGLIPRRLPFSTSNTIVRTFRHAVSLDERRAKFKANLWNRPNAHEAALGVQGQKPEVPVVASSVATERKKFVGNGGTLRALERKYSGISDRPTDVEEIDVGGGSVVDGTPHTLARIPLRWMIRECFKADCGIIFISDELRLVGLDPATLYPHVQQRPSPLPLGGAQIQHIPSSNVKALPNYSGTDTLVEITKTEEEYELQDALSPIYDQLSLAWFWWFLELLPLKRRLQHSDNSWTTYFSPNFGHGRIIPHQKKQIKVHRSVKLRMDAQYPDGTKYKPQASFDEALALGNVQWID